MDGDETLTDSIGSMRRSHTRLGVDEPVPWGIKAVIIAMSHGSASESWQEEKVLHSFLWSEELLCAKWKP